MQEINEYKYILTIITVVHDNLSGIINIYKDLIPLLKGDIQWVIKDSGYSEGIIKWHKEISNKDIVLIVGNDSGIYDALNIALKSAEADLYLVVGSDDRFLVNNFLDFIALLKSGRYLNFDFIALPVKSGFSIYWPRARVPLSWSVSSLLASHSCGLIIKKSIHLKIGLYSTSYRILSDSLFILKSYQTGSNFYYEKFPIGIFNRQGVSSSLTLTRSLEAFKLQTECGSPFFIQFIYLILRILLVISSKLLK